MALILTIINYLIIPNKTGLHAITLGWIVPYIYLTYFMSTSYTSEWITNAADSLRWLAL